MLYSLLPILNCHVFSIHTAKSCHSTPSISHFHYDVIWSHKYYKHGLIVFINHTRSLMKGTRKTVYGLYILSHPSKSSSFQKYHGCMKLNVIYCNNKAIKRGGGIAFKMKGWSREQNMNVLISVHIARY